MIPYRLRLHLLCLLLAGCFSTPLFAQRESIALSGTLTDSITSETIPGILVRAFSPRDTTKGATTVSDPSGKFSLSLTPGFYLIRISGLSFATKTLRGRFVQDESLGNIRLVGKETLLKEVVVKETQVRAEQKGDTVQYRAGSYKVNTQANAEDLISKMPGVVSENGGVKVNGEQIRQVLLDGKPFFGEDPNLALRNLPAEMIDRVQVFDKMSDQAQFTRFDDGNSNKTLNIITKQGKNTGTFGKGSAGYGDQDRFASSITLNRFEGQRRFSFLGLANNTNVQNFSQQDLSGVFGQGSGMGRMGMGMGGGGGRGGSMPTGSPSTFGPPTDPAANFMVSNLGGINTSLAAGVNYSDAWGKKLTLTASYFVNNVENENSNTLERIFRAGSSKQFQYAENSQGTGKSLNHRVNLRVEWNIDSLNSIIFTPKLSVQTSQTTNAANGSYYLDPITIVGGQQSNTGSRYQSLNTGGNITWRHSFRKVGRTISIGYTHDHNIRPGNGNVSNASNFGTENTQLMQEWSQENNGYVISPTLVYTEPQGANGQWMANYSPSFRYTKNQRLVDVPVNSVWAVDTALSSSFFNSYQAQRGGLGYRFNRNKLMTMVGTDWQMAILNGQATFPNSVLIERSFYNWMPYAIFNYKVNGGTNLRVVLRTTTNPPSVTQMQSVVNTSNPLLWSTGNPSLLQEFAQIGVIRYGATNPQSGKGLFLFAFLNLTRNYIGSATYSGGRTIEGIELPRGAQLTRPENLNGYYIFRSMATFSWPLPVIKCNLNLGASYNQTRTPSKVNDVLNLATNRGWGTTITLTSNISDAVDFTFTTNPTWNQTQNSIQSTLNNAYFMQLSNGKATVTLRKRLVLNINATHTWYRNLPTALAPNVLLLGAYIGWQFLPSRNLEVKIQGFDLLNQNNSFNRTVTETFVDDNRTLVLKRYMLLVVTYNLRPGQKKPPQAP